MIATGSADAPSDSPIVDATTTLDANAIDATTNTGSDANPDEAGVLQPPQLPSPVFSPSPGTERPQSVMIMEPVANFGAIGGVIRYIDPETGKELVYTGPIHLPASCSTFDGVASFSAFASAPGYGDSPQSEARYVMVPPAFDPPGTTAGNDFLLSLSLCPGLNICYTLDGNEPGCNHNGVCFGPVPPSTRPPEYVGGLLIDGTVTDPGGAVVVNVAGCLGAGRGVLVRGSQSYVLRAISPTMQNPAPGTLPPQAGGYVPTISSGTSGSYIRYTTDGSQPTCTSGQTPQPTTIGTTSSGTIAIGQTTTIGAIACKVGYAPSAPTAFTYRIE
jgi:hypothetical protein